MAAVRGLALAALVAVSTGQETYLPIFCRLLSAGLDEASFHPLLKGLHVDTTAKVPLLGDVDVHLHGLELGSVSLSGCDAWASEDGTIAMSVSQLDIGVKSLAWNFSQHRWPHEKDAGMATADTSVSMDIQIDIVKAKKEISRVRIAHVGLHLSGEHHTWLAKVLQGVVNGLVPHMGLIVSTVVGKQLDKTLGLIHKEGACAFVTGELLPKLDHMHLAFHTSTPIQVHIPLIGEVNVNVNSTSITPPAQLNCEKLAFNGFTLTAHIESVPFQATFDWAYNKVNSKFWHNHGSASADIVAGTLLHIDLVKPQSTKVEVDIPKLKLKLHAAADAWMYDALDFVMTPLIRVALQLFGGRIVAHEIEKCLEDPTCPHLKPKEEQASLDMPERASTAVIMV